MIGFANRKEKKNTTVIPVCWVVILKVVECIKNKKVYYPINEK